MSLRAACVLFAILVGASAAARADAPEPAPLPKPRSVSMEGYGAENPACLEWTNGCQVCAAAGPTTGGKPACSTQGAACTVGPVVCTRRK
jgi:hypothetical protein